MVAVLGALVMAASPALAQQDREHEALVRALRMQQPSDPMWQAMMRIADKIYPIPPLPLEGVGIPPNARAFHQRFQRINFVGGYVTGQFSYWPGISLVTFDRSQEATVYSATTVRTGGELYVVTPACRRIVGGRHVIEIRGQGCLVCRHPEKNSVCQRSLDFLLGLLASQANQALSSLPPPDADQAAGISGAAARLCRHPCRRATAGNQCGVAARTGRRADR